TYLFRPLPFEARSLFSFASSLDNAFLLLLGLAWLYNKLVHRNNKHPGNRAFLWLYSLICWVALANTTANLGIAARQKWMFTPMIILLLISTLGDRRGQPLLRFRDNLDTESPEKVK